MPFWQLSPVCSGCGALQKSLQHLAAFRFQNAPGNLHLMVKLGHFQYIQDRTCTSRLGIHAAHHYFRDTGLHNGTGAHLAGFQGHIERAFFQTPVADHFAGFVDRCDLCVRQCILVCISPVVTTTDDLTFMYNDTADGDFPQGIGFFACFRASFIYFSSTLLITAMVSVAFLMLALSEVLCFGKPFPKITLYFVNAVH